MKNLSLLFLVILLTLPAMAQDTGLAARMDSLLSASYSPDGPGGVALVKKGDQVILRKAYGMADLELDVPMKPENVFRIGSITKQFTAVAILQLRDEGKLNLDEPMTTYLKKYPAETGDKVTVKHLLDHTSGIPSYTGLPEFGAMMRKDMSPAEITETFKDLPLEFEPGTDWSYNNSAYILLGMIIEEVSGQTYEEYIKQHIFEPLQMTSSYYGDPEKIIPNRVEGYSKRGDDVSIAGYLSMTLPYAAGSLLSSVDDLAKWDEALYDERIVSQAALKEAWTNTSLADKRSTGYGYGWFSSELNGKQVIEHGGGINGFVSYFIRVPEEELVVVTLQNFNGQNVSQIAERLLMMAMDVNEVPETAKVSSKKMKEYAGNYKLEGGDFRVVTLEDGKLYSQRTGQEKLELIPVGKDAFYYTDEPTGRFLFVRDKKGKITDLAYQPRIGMATYAVITDEAPPAGPQEIEMEPEAFEAFTGEYELAPEFVLTVSREGDALMIQGTGQPAIRVFPMAESRFFARAIKAEVEFKEEGGEVTSLVLFQNGQEMPARKIK